MTFSIGTQDPLVIVGIEPMIGLHRDDIGAEASCVAHERSGLDAVGLGRVAGGDRYGRLRRRLHDDDGLFTQGRGLLLLAGREEGVEVEEQPSDGGGLAFVHRLFYSPLMSPFATARFTSTISRCRS
jgi:hypothetical protein